MRFKNTQIPEDLLSERELQYLRKYANDSLNILSLWKLMDQEWDCCQAGYSLEKSVGVKKFYESPVWLLNGLFTETDPISIRHRTYMARWIAQRKPRLIAELGGGFGSLGRKVAALLPETQYLIVEPHPTKLAQHLANGYDNLAYVTSLPDKADLVIAQDVLEHVPDPIATFGELLEATRVGGSVLTANCFYPVIKCHLPSTFHFRNSFRFIVAGLGCKYEGVIPGVAHTEFFRKSNPKSINWEKIRRFEKLSRSLHPWLEPVAYLARPWPRLFHRYFVR